MPSDHSALATKWFQVTVAFTALFIGSLVYVLDRPPDSTIFFGAMSLGHQLSGVFGWIGGSLPSFTHTFSLSVLTAVWLGGGNRVCLTACLSWFAIDCAFEIGQHAPVADALVRFMPNWFERLPLLGQARGYFLMGTFDVADLVSIAIGAATAYLLMVNTLPRDMYRD